MNGLLDRCLSCIFRDRFLDLNGLPDWEIDRLRDWLIDWWTGVAASRLQDAAEFSTTALMDWLTIELVDRMSIGLVDRLTVEAAERLIALLVD